MRTYGADENVSLSDLEDDWMLDSDLVSLRNVVEDDPPLATERD